MTKLSVNVNKVATLRNTRSLEIPSIVKLSRVALEAGAHGITVHPRPDQRHIRPADVTELAELLKSFPRAEYNIEGNPFHGLIEHCVQVRPHQATLVPDAREAFTSNHGWNLAELDATSRAALSRTVSELKAVGCRVSLFLDPVAEIMPLARELGADRVELYTEPYAAAAAAGRGAESIALYGRRRGARCRPGRQRRPRSQLAQPRGFREGRGPDRRGVHRSRAHRGRAGARHGGNGTALPGAVRLRLALS